MGEATWLVPCLHTLPSNISTKGPTFYGRPWGPEQWLCTRRVWCSRKKPGFGVTQTWVQISTLLLAYCVTSTTYMLLSLQQFLSCKVNSFKKYLRTCFVPHAMAIAANNSSSCSHRAYSTGDANSCLTALLGIIQARETECLRVGEYLPRITSK